MSRFHGWASDNQNLPLLFGVPSAAFLVLTALITHSTLALTSIGTSCGLLVVIGFMAAAEERAETRRRQTLGG